MGDQNSIIQSLSSLFLVPVRHVPVSDGTTGNVLDSGVSIDSSQNIAGVANLIAQSVTTGGGKIALNVDGSADWNFGSIGQIEFGTPGGFPGFNFWTGSNFTGPRYIARHRGTYFEQGFQAAPSNSGTLKVYNDDSVSVVGPLTAGRAVVGTDSVFGGDYAQFSEAGRQGATTFGILIGDTNDLTNYYNVPTGHAHHFWVGGSSGNVLTLSAALAAVTGSITASSNITATGSLFAAGGRISTDADGEQIWELTNGTTTRVGKIAYGVPGGTPAVMMWYGPSFTNLALLHHNNTNLSLGFSAGPNSGNDIVIRTDGSVKLSNGVTFDVDANISAANSITVNSITVNSAAIGPVGFDSSGNLNNVLSMNVTSGPGWYIDSGGNFNGNSLSTSNYSGAVYPSQIVGYPGDGTLYLDGSGSWSTPPGGGGGTSSQSLSSVLSVGNDAGGYGMTGVASITMYSGYPIFFATVGGSQPYIYGAYDGNNYLVLNTGNVDRFRIRDDGQFQVWDGGSWQVGLTGGFNDADSVFHSVTNGLITS